MKHGLGTLRWDDGDEYVGQFSEDEKTVGTFNWKGGDSYTGEWKHSLMHGYGVYTYRNGRKYEGHWEGGFKEGKGIFTWPNGDKYEGQFHKDQCHGFGKQTYADERVYMGEWFQNKKHGYGTMTWSNGEKTQGQWQNNLLTGNAIFTDTKGVRHEEKWKNGTRDQGRIVLRRKDDEMQQLLQATNPPTWAPDRDYNNCYKCDALFTVMFRRHHCRHCGFVFCGDCTEKKVPIPQLRFNEPVRVCDECFIALKTHEISQYFQVEFNKDFPRSSEA